MEVGELAGEMVVDLTVLEISRHRSLWLSPIIYRFLRCLNIYRP